jgi:hypothetical protein
MTNIEPIADMPEANSATTTTEAPAIKRGPTKVAKGVRSSAKPAKAKATGKAAKETERANPYAKATVNDRGLKLPPGKGVDWVADLVGNKTVVWCAGATVEWPEAAKETGKAVEAQLKKAGKAGLTWNEIQGSVNRLGYLIRKGKVDLVSRAKAAKSTKA